MWPVFARIAQAEKEILKSRPLDYYFPFVGGNFPYNGDAPDITISSNTVWDDFIGFKQVGKLTINAGVTLKIEQSPFIIFADEIVFGGTDSIIDGSGPSGAASGDHPSWCAKGATVVGNGGRVQAGCGGIMLLIVTNRISGAKGSIRANGGDGWAQQAPSSRQFAQGGQGALSALLPTDAPPEAWGGLGFYLARGGGNVSNGGGGTGGGSGGQIPGNYNHGGGSGIGGGGASGAGTAGYPCPGTHNLKTWMFLHSLNCLGGGGGAAFNSTTPTAAGGGGGLVGLLVGEIGVAPILEANGGVADGPAYNGGAGFTFIEDVSLWGVEL
jgi:hypothetical protein